MFERVLNICLYTINFNEYGRLWDVCILNPSRLNDGRSEKIFICALLCGVSKDFMKALKAFKKPLQAPKKNCENKNLT